MKRPPKKRPVANPLGWVQWNAKHLEPLVESGPITVIKYRDGKPVSEEVVAAIPPGTPPRLSNEFYRQWSPKEYRPFYSSALHQAIRSKKKR